ncbi:PAS domain S-box protein [Virgibacillus siamensis]|uniref:PAS domain S-box protein n=1 Tax=Virgibacillus siamensis TaxID=480071 RepID=UPI0009879C63|nr:PAS domain S-box protein [Virgibacillus siamensis]
MQTTFNLDNPSLFIHAFDRASIGMAIVATDGTPLKVNRSLCDILGYPESKLLSIKFKDITHPDDIESNLSLMYEALKGIRKSYQMEKRFIHKDGYQVWALLSVSLVRDDHDQPLYFISHIQDITDWKFAEEKSGEGEKRLNSLVEETPELMLKFEKLTVAGQLAAGIAHEVRNPLTAIKGFLQLMQSNPTDNKEYSEVIFSELNRIEELLSELLVLARPQKVKSVKRGLKVLLAQVISLIETQAKQNDIKIEKYIESDLPDINCDGNQIKQVFINLLKNAIEAMPNGGTIFISLKKHNADTLLIRIEDQGYGIPDHLLSKIGNPFFTTKDDGTGLGIMICHQIIEKHKGVMKVASSSEGAVVKVYLPLIQASSNRCSC